MILCDLIPDAPGGKQMIIFIDDLNMPRPDRFGSQPPIELLRQYQDCRGFYDRDKLFWKVIEEPTICFGIEMEMGYHLKLKWFSFWNVCRRPGSMI